MKGAARDVLLPPLHSQNVIPPLLDDVCDVVLLIAHMLHGDLFTGGGGPVNSDQQHVGTSSAAVHQEGALLAYEGLGESGPFGCHFAGVRG